MACKPFIVEDVSYEMKERILTGLSNSGASIEGDNPWKVDLNRAGIELEAEWLEDRAELKVCVTRKLFVLKCSKVNSELRKEIEKSRDDDNDDDLFADIHLGDDM